MIFAFLLGVKLNSIFFKLNPLFFFLKHFYTTFQYLSVFGHVHFYNILYFKNVKANLQDLPPIMSLIFYVQF